MTYRYRSRKSFRAATQWAMAALAASVFVCGVLWQNASLLGVGATILFFVLWRVGSERAPQSSDGERRERTQRVRGRQVARDVDDNSEQFAEAKFPSRDTAPKSTDGFVDELVANGRYALMLRPETKQHLTQVQ